jgi:hypothetical protein
VARIRTVDFLPEIFKTDVNREFLGATLDQLVQEPELKRMQGYIGRRFGPGTRYNDSYVLEPTAIRSNYQLEPGVVFKDSDDKVTDAITYPGLIDALNVKGANVTRHDRLFASETYSFDPSIDFDKFINYGQYYWLPAGPDAVDVQSTDVALTDEFVVTQSDNNQYNLSGIAGNNPTITLVRGGSYTFEVDQDSSFWIQAEAGVDGKFNFAPNISTRGVSGVTNNGAQLGTITFNVPTADSQQFYHDLTSIEVNLATTQRFDSINHKFVSEFEGIDGITDLEGKTLVFLQDQPGDSYDLGWQRVGQFDNVGYDSEDYEPTTYLDTQAERYSLFRIEYVRPNGSSDEGMYINLVAVQEIDTTVKFTIGYGTEYSNRTFFKNANGYFEEQPLLTAANDVLYYQDGTAANKFGIINLINEDSAQTLNINDEILGKLNYTSPNGVTFTNGLKVIFRGNVTPATYQNKEYFVNGVGSAITLTLVADLLTTESWYNNVNGTVNQPQSIDYLTIKQDSIDNNPWSRSNRWVHADVINKTAEYNNTVPVFDNDYRAKRPIIEFNSNIRLFNNGTQSIGEINVIDFTETDALSNINGSIGYAVDGYNLVNGSRIVFANDTDPDVKNKIYEVTLADPDDDSSEYPTIIILNPVEDVTIDEDNILLCRSGDTLEGKQFYFDGTDWIESQRKTGVNQAPLFDMFDADGYSFSDTTKYPSTNFAGSKLFSYKVGSTVAVDPILGFSLTYENIDNIGDIVFENHQYTDTFVSAPLSTLATESVSSGFTRFYSDRTTYTSACGWVTSADKNWQRQVFTYQYDGTPLYTDVAPRTDLNIPAIKVYVENKFVSPSTYSLQNTGQQAIVSFNSTSAIESGDIVQVKIISDTASTVAYYEVPTNLESNIFNEDKSTFTLGTVRNHYNRLIENSSEFSGEINGANNTRDIGNLATYGDTIVQHSAPTAAMSYFLRNYEHDFFNALERSAQDYQNFKNQILHWVEINDVYGMSSAEILDAALADINVGKTSDSAYYWDEMLPFGGDYVENANTVSVISTRNYNTTNLYDFTSANTKGLLVYHNDVLLLKDTDYTVATDGPRITLTFDPAIGDTIVIREYATTYGSFVPPTPTKLGLYPEKDPSIYTDYTYVNPKTVIQGHDGSITIGFDDERDNVLLEFERRIYNNLKLDGNELPLTPEDVIPGEFRTTDYSLTEINEMLSEQFLDWTGWNKIDYKTQNYQSDNEWTWNYSTATCILDQSLLPGHWRGIYTKYYDTDHPHLHPWEMLGIRDEPSWWETVYGPAPYTKGNLVMWEDLEAGYIAEPGNERYDTRYARPRLTEIIPADSEGNLAPPLAVLVGNYNSLDFRKSWNFGDGGPAEAAWRKSSAFPFAVQKLLALTKPAEYFALMADRDRYKWSDTVGQYVYDSRYRYDFRDTEIANINVTKHSYINWIVDSQRLLGILDSSGLSTKINQTDIRLTYRVTGFTGKNYLKVYTDKSSPDSSNASLILPDESYSLLLYKNQPFTDLQYSSVMIQKTVAGYAVYGNSQTEAYFRIKKSKVNGDYVSAEMGNTSYRLPKEFTDTTVRVPYGYSFTSVNSVLDFLMSYGAYLESQGLIFEDYDNGYELNWGQMCNEFLTWANQGWSEGALININPAANQLQFSRNRAVVDDLNNLAVNELPLDQNRTPLTNRDYAVSRLDNLFKLTSMTGKSLSYLRLRATAYEHLLVLDNTSIFNDLIYDPVTGLRQMRIRVDGLKTTGWDGQLNARGFVLNEDNVAAWRENANYNKGDLVEYKNSYWSAAEKLQPTDTFNFEDWIKVEYDQITNGLLPNIANKSEQIKYYYNNRVANLEQDADLLGLGLTGFRKRDYLEALNLDDVSQVEVYSNLIQNKGTTPTAKLFQNVEFDKETSEYDIYENWAVKRAVYGASDDIRFVEVELDKSLLRSNPSTIGIGEGPETMVSTLHPSHADQHIDVDNIYKQSVKNSSNNIIPELNEVITDVALPTAGYVSRDDVDIALFDINDLSEIDNNLDKVKDGAHVWVARKNPYDWDVYRCTAIPQNYIEVNDNLNGTLTVTFSEDHGLLRGGILVIKQFNTSLNGAHRVRSVNDIRNITIAGSLSSVTPSIAGQALLYTLLSARLAEATDAYDKPYANNLLTGDKIWVDSNQAGNWAVYEKREQFKSSQSQTPPGTSASIGFGASVAQGLASNGLLVGATAYTSATGSTTGGLFCYNSDGTNLVFNTVISNVNGAESYGASLDFSTNWAVAGAPQTQSNDGIAVLVYRNPAQNLFQEFQALTLPSADQSSAGEFGTSVAMSEDENWVYVSAPEINKVYAYQKVTYQNQLLEYVSDGNTASYNLTGLVEVDTEEQVTVVVDGATLNVSEYTILGNTLTIRTVPTAGELISIQRNYSVEATGDGVTSYFNEISELYTANDNLESFQVYVNGVLQLPYYDYDYAVDSTNAIEFTVAPAADSSITFRAADYYMHVDTIDASTYGVNFGSGLATTSDGQQVYVGNELATVDSVTQAGEVYVFERLVERLIVTNATQTIYSTLRSVNETANVAINNEKQLNSINNEGSVYTINSSLNTVTFSSNTDLLVGNTIDIDINEFNLVQTLALGNTIENSKFGSTISVCRTDCSVYVGAPYDSTVLASAGSVTRFVNNSRIRGTITGTEQNPTLTPGDTIRINNIDVIVTGRTVEEFANDINNSITPNVQASASNGYLTIQVINTNEAAYLSKLTVMPGEGTAFDDLGLAPFANVQTIRAPIEHEYAYFGSTVFVDYSALTLVIGAKQGTTYHPTTFDGSRETIFDSDSTRLFDGKTKSGAVYTYDLLPSSDINATGKFVFGQQIFDQSVTELDQFGYAVDYTNGIMVVASPSYDTAVSNIGRIVTFVNKEQTAAWELIHEKPKVADVRKAHNCYIYDKESQDIKVYVDFIDPMNGKLLGVVKENLDYITPVDPAVYNDGNKTAGIAWANMHIGELWWDTTNVRYNDYNQNDIKYSSKNWATLFPGSTVEVYEWVESTVPPSSYNGEVLDASSYSTMTGVDNTQTIVTRYYFWAKNTTTLNVDNGKTLSAQTIADYIEYPQSSGIPYVALMRKNVFALYNANEYLLDDKNSVLHIEYNQTLDDNKVFVEVDLIKDSDPKAFVSDQIWRKMKDSLCGVDLLGNQVPDYKLSPSDKYGVSFRPRQSMFKNRFEALETFLTRANTLLLTQPFAELRTFNLLNAEEAQPLTGTGAWDKKVSDLTELAYQDTAVDGAGYKYLVEADSSNNGVWTIYTVQDDFSLSLTRVQSYDTANYWDYANWYATGYSNLTKPAKIVTTYSELLTLSESDGTVVRVTTNSDNKWELYVYSGETSNWTRIGLQNGTIQLSEKLWDYSVSKNGWDFEVFDSQYWDEEPVLELRNILEALAFEILTGDFVYFRNQLLILAFNYILHEQGKVDWLYKTSLIDVNHKVRDLDQYPVYRKDNQDFVLDYIMEVKPYHVQLKEFLTRYEGFDTVAGNVYDFDCPSAYDADYSQFISPVLDDGIAILETDNSNRKDYYDVNTNQAASQVWDTRPWSTWYDNRLLSVISAAITNGGSGYTVIPQVTFSGEATTQATATATINESGEVSGITITSYGSGYRTTPVITISGGNGTGATAAAITKHDTVRDLITTIKYDRYDYSSEIVDWEPNTVYNTNDLVRYNDRVYKAINADGSTPSDATFDPLQYEIVLANTLAAVDRTAGYYVADVNKPGLDLALLINGLDYPQVQLKGPGFEYNTGYDVGNFDISVFDNIEYSPEGQPTYSESILDNEIFTSFTGSYTGVDLSGIESVQATATATISGLEVTALTPTEIGKGYSADILPTVTISAPRDNLTATATAATDGDALTAITVTSSGFGYLSTPTVTITEQDPTAGIQTTGNAELTAGAVTDVVISNSGTGYTTAPTVTFADPPSVTAARATATAALTAGAVSGTTVTSGGASYASAPAVTVTAPPASVTATGTATVSGYAVSSATVTEDGNYYSVAPTVTVSAPTETAIQALATANISSGGVTSISISNTGHMYQSAPAVTITAQTTAGTTATATATLDTDISGFDTDDGFDAVAFDAEGGVGTITVIVPGDGYTVAPIVTISAPDISGGTQATATATVSGDSAPLQSGEGYVVSITVTDPGSGYTSAPTVSIAAPDANVTYGSGATATATLSDTDVISITVGSGGTGYTLTPTVSIDAPTTPYTATVTAAVSGGIVTGLTVSDAGWGYASAPTLTIADPDVTPVTAAFTAVLTGDAVTSLTTDTAGAGYLTAPTLTIDVDPSVSSFIATGTAVLLDDGVASVTITNAGSGYVSSPTVTFGAPDGLAYHGSGATATATVTSNGVTAITITNAGSGYDLAPTVTVSAPTRTTRQATATPVVIGGGVTSFAITDAGWGYLTTPTVTVGTPSDIDPDADIVGGEFVDVYNSHAPEELVPGAIFDTLDMRVYTRPGFDYNKNGHGWEVKSVIHEFVGAGNNMSWAGLLDYPAALVVFNNTTGVRLYENEDYTVDWSNKTINVTAGATLAQTIKIFVYSIGGGNQLYKTAITGDLLSDNQRVIPVNYTDIDTMLIRINGEEFTNYTFAAGEFASQTNITFTGSFDATDYISVIVFAENPSEDSTYVDLTYSIPETQLFTYSGSASFTLSEAFAHAGQENLIVEHNGLRLQPATGRRHIGDGSSITTYELPDGERTGIDMSDVTADDVEVYINMIRQVSGTNYQLDPADDSSNRTITFLTEVPGPEDVVDIYVTRTNGQVIEGVEQGKHARYTVDGTTLTIITGLGLTLSTGDRIAVTSFKDIREQDVFTQIYKGSIETSTASRELWDQYGFDMDLWDRVVGVITAVNLFALDRAVTNSDRMWVTLDGRRLNPATDFSVSSDGLTMVIAGAPISETSIVAVTSFTNSIVPDALGFRIFKDMRDNTAVYRLLDTTQTSLVQELKWTDDVIYVEDASRLGEPNLESAIFGIVTINGERITYRERDLVNNTLSGLRRGTAGTGMHRSHAVDSVVFDIGGGEMYQPAYSNAIKWEKDTTYTAGEVVKFRNTYYRAKIDVPVSYGITDVFDDNYLYPSITVFDTTYWEEYDKSWYATGTTTATNGVALQQQTTVAANFFKGN